MSARLSAILHIVSALYAAVVIGFVAVFVPKSLVSPTEVRMLLAAAASFLALDAAAVILQWRKPTPAQRFSVALHFAFAAAVIAVVTFEFLQNQARFSAHWLLKNDYGFLLLLGLSRLLAGGFLLEKESRGKSAPE